MSLISPVSLYRAEHPKIKRLMDLIVASGSLIVLSPALLLLAFMVKLDGGPALYGQKRIAKNGKIFSCWKFRSMVPDADKVLQQLLTSNLEARSEWERDFKLKNDPRITRIGKILRQTSLDELPQLFNVLKGDMSLIGPRPITEAEMHYYNDDIHKYLAVAPGITGLWQVSGRNDVSYDERVALDVRYVTNWSLWLDFKILVKTMKVMVVRTGAY